MVTLQTEGRFCPGLHWFRFSTAALLSYGSHAFQVATTSTGVRGFQGFQTV